MSDPIDRENRPASPGPEPQARPEAESYARIASRPALVLAVLASLAALQFRPKPEPNAPVVIPVPAPAPSAVPSPVVLPPPTSKPGPKPKRAPRPTPPAPPLDRAAVARAEESLDEASRERARADARLAQAERALDEASVQVAKDLAESKTIASRVRDPSARIASASTKGGFLRGERDKLKAELAALERVPQPKSKPLLAKNAVSKPTDGAEYHFEVRRNRVSYLDLDRLVDMVKTDARLRLRAGGNRGRLSSMVGPVGSFSLSYVMGRALPDAIAEVVDVRETTYNLIGWEVVPGIENRGETFEATRGSASNYSRAINRLTPGRDTVTMWIYPDGFGLYRQLRDELHARGFLVAARPLPEGTSIKGSPAGSLSAGQ